MRTSTRTVDDLLSSRDAESFEEFYVRQQRVLRVDPRTGRVARIATGGDPNAFGGDPVTGIGVAVLIDGTLWVHASDTAGGRDRLVEVDLETGRVRSSTGLPQFGIQGFTVVGDNLWLGTPNGHVMIVRR